MANSEKERLAAEVEDRWVDFQGALSDKRKYPVEHFRAFWDAGKRYAELTRNDPLIHRKVVAAINGLREFLSVERKRIPGTIIADADRLESMFFSGYDPSFEGGRTPRAMNGSAACLVRGRLGREQQTFAKRPRIPRVAAARAA